MSPFKLTKLNTGQKVRNSRWPKDHYFVPEFVGNKWTIGQFSDGDEMEFSVEDWELYEEPKSTEKIWGRDVVFGESPPPSVWWEEGKVYKSKITGAVYRFNSTEHCCIASYKVSTGNYFQCSGLDKQWFIDNKEDFEEYIPESSVEYSACEKFIKECADTNKKTIRMAPALLKCQGLTILTPHLYKSEAEAQSNYPSRFIQWPASDSLWVEVPVEEDK